MEMTAGRLSGLFLIALSVGVVCLPAGSESQGFFKRFGGDKHMTDNNKVLKIFMMPQQFPCGPEAACCGPVGQSEEEIQNLKDAIENETDLQAEVINVLNENEMKSFSDVDQLVFSLGYKSLPIITLNNKTVSMGNSTPGQAVSAIKETINMK